MNREYSEKLASYLGADAYDGLDDWWTKDQYKPNRRYTIIGVCLVLAICIFGLTNCGGPDVGDPNDGPASTLSE